ncbi:predicted protein [Naegleria gruberi]|uniref:Predicted protein n=1 Tax=Naegleria gruberi TaxID=5762 RepID=D2VSW3_NAEGR|nr:uncharacterized protein NAEGRDRAFT_51994 [Naegleria gruberi]EFC40050.1 predicted protein [Naegleria gruberi]|eukprot:XP_002672794.1 predicted protein [Naegleria gruberi strain NEG-M]
MTVSSTAAASSSSSSSSSNGKHIGCENPIIINAGRSECSLTAHLITLFLAREYPMQKFILTSSFESGNSNDVLFLDVEGTASLGKLIDWHLLKGKVSYRNLKGYSVNIMLDNKRELSAINERKALIKVSDLKRAIVDFLSQTSPNVEMRLECFDEQMEIKNSQDQKLPSLKYITKEGNQEEILSQMIIDCERKSFVLRSLLSSFNSSLSVSQSPSNYAYMRLNIPFDVLNPLMSDDEIHVFQSEEVTLMAVPTFDQNSFSSTVFFKIPDLETHSNILSKFFVTQFPSTYPLISEYISNQFTVQRPEIVYNYKIGSASVGNILFIDSSEIPLFGDQKLQNCFEFLQLLRDDIGKYGITRADSQILKSTISFNQKEEDVNFIQSKITKFKEEREKIVKSKNSIMKLCWNVAKMPFVAVGNHLLEVFGFKPSDLSTGQKWMFRIAYVITAFAVKGNIQNYLELRSFTNAMVKKVGGSSTLFAEIVHQGAKDKWNLSSQLQRIVWNSTEVLTIPQIEAISGILKYSFSKKEFLDLLISSGNIQKMNAMDLLKIFTMVDLITCSSKLKMIEKLKDFIYLDSKNDIKIILADFYSSSEKELATQILQGCVRSK